MSTKRQIKLIITIIVGFLAITSFANGVSSSYHYQQVHNGYNVTQDHPVVITKRPYHSYPWATHGKLSVTVYDGSLKANLVRIIKYFGWNHVIWTVPYDFDWVGQVNIRGNSVEDIVAQILVNYPLQAVFYEGNKVVVIKPRINR